MLVSVGTRKIDERIKICFERFVILRRSVSEQENPEQAERNCANGRVHRGTVSNSAKCVSQNRRDVILRLCLVGNFETRERLEYENTR